MIRGSHCGMKMAVFWAVAPWYEFTDVSEVCTVSIIRAMSGMVTSPSYFSRMSCRILTSTVTEWCHLTRVIKISSSTFKN
jgi:hypothetical protein